MAANQDARIVAGGAGDCWVRYRKTCVFDWETEEGTKVVYLSDIVVEQGWQEFCLDSLLYIRRSIQDVANYTLYVLSFLLQRALNGRVHGLQVQLGCGSQILDG